MWKPIILDVECIVCNKTLHKINHDPREINGDMGKLSISRRSRTPNWSLEEKQFLLDLIKERKEVVVTKNNNGPNYSEEKDIAWNEILRELAVKFGNKFVGSSTKKVKTQWQNMKRIAREEIASNGSSLEKFTRQSIDVCHILDMIKDGVLKIDEASTAAAAPVTPPEPTGEQSNTAVITQLPSNVQIKTERIDEDSQPQPRISVVAVPMDISDYQHLSTASEQNRKSSMSSHSEQPSDSYDYDNMDDISTSERESRQKNESTMTEAADNNYAGLFQRSLQDFFRFTATEKNLKIETLKEERQVVRAMRETAELNKIIAEQKLKHFLMVKKHDIA